MKRIQDIQEQIALGNGKHIVDRSTHPQFYVSSWPLGAGHQTLAGRERYRLPHLNYNSVLITVISNHWGKDGWWRLQEMIKFTQELGFTVALEEVDDLSTMPTDAIGIMRACAAQLALDSGFEWCFMVDTDVLLEKDTLAKLIARDVPVCYPLLDDLEDKYKGASLSSPVLYPNIGMHRVVWAAMSAMLFNCKVFNCLDANAWHGHDYHFSQMLGHYGHHIMVDTDTVVGVSRGPSRHQSKDWDTLWRDMERGYRSRQDDDRDRRPPPDFDPVFGHGYVDRDGVYWATDKDAYSGVRGPMTSAQQDHYDKIAKGLLPAGSKMEEPA